MVLPGSLPGSARDARCPPGRGARADDGGLCREAAGLRRPHRAVRGDRQRPVQACRRPRRHAPARDHDGEAGQPVRSRPRRCVGRRRDRLRGAHQLRHPTRRRAALMATIAVLSDCHGNAAALDAVRKAIGREKPDAVLVAGDLVLNGPQPAETLDAVRALDGDGALVVSGNTDIAVADFDYAAAFPWMEDVPDSIRAAAEWAHDELDDDRLEWLPRLPAERRLRIEGTLVLVVHASPGSQTRGFDRALDATVVLERASATDARVVCGGHTHVPEVRDLGWKVIVNDGSAGYVFDGDPTASWALVAIDGDTVMSEIRRTPYDAIAVANDISARGLPGDLHRAAPAQTGKLVRGRGAGRTSRLVSSAPGGAASRPSATTSGRRGTVSSPVAPGSARSRASIPRARPPASPAGSPVSTPPAAWIARTSGTSIAISSSGSWPPGRRW